MMTTAESKTEIARLRERIERGAKVISLGGLTSIAAKAFVLSHLQRETAKTFVVVADTNKDSENWECDLDFWVKSKKADSQIFSLPSFETDIYSGVSPHAETLEKRALALWNLSFGKPDFLITSAKSLITRTVSPSEIRNLGAVLKLDEDYAPDDLIEKLVASGYVRAEPIANVGEFSVRGGILDVWSPSAEMPVRIEFFGDTVDSIRQFDPDTQLSVGQLKEIALAPMREFAAGAKDFRDWAFFARERFADERFARAVQDRADFADEGESFSGWEFLMPLINPRKSVVFDYLKDAVFVVDEPPLVEQTLANYYENLSKHLAEITEAGEIGLEPRELFLTGAELREKLKGTQRLELRILGKSAAATGESLEFENEVPASVIELSGRKSGNNGDGKKPERNPLFLFPTAEINEEFEIGSRATRKFHGNLPDFADNLKSNYELRITNYEKNGDERKSKAFRDAVARHRRTSHRDLARLPGFRRTAVVFNRRFVGRF